MSSPRLRSLGLIAATQLGLVGCSAGLAPSGDGPGARIDPDTLVPMQPRAEPKSRYGNPESYVVNGRRYHVRDNATGYVEEGVASWYGRKFHGRRTSSGETYNMYALTAAHRSLPLPTYVRVTNLDNDRSTVVKVNDRGPFHDERLIDLSYAAATQLGFADTGTAPVRIRALNPGEGGDHGGAVTADAEPAAPRAGGQGRFIQVGAFERFANAQNVRARVQGLDIRAVEVTRGRSAGGARVYRVLVGPFADPAERERILGDLENAGLGPAHIVRAP